VRCNIDCAFTGSINSLIRSTRPAESKSSRQNLWRGRCTGWVSLLILVCQSGAELGRSLWFWGFTFAYRVRIAFPWIFRAEAASRYRLVILNMVKKRIVSMKASNLDFHPSNNWNWGPRIIAAAEAWPSFGEKTGDRIGFDSIDIETWRWSQRRWKIPLGKALSKIPTWSHRIFRMF